MPETNAKFSYLLNNPRRTALLGAVVLFLLCTVIFLLGYYYSKNYSPSYTKTPSKVIEVLDESGPIVRDNKEIYRYSGTVTKVTDQAVYFIATYTEDLKIIESEIEAQITGQTIFLKRDLSEVYKTAPEKYTEMTGAEEIKQNNIKEGDLVIAFSQSNIKYQTAFPASKIELAYWSQEF